MIWLISGLFLWVAGHSFKRVLPDVRQSLGDPGKGVSAAIILAGVVLMVIGYRGWDADIAFVPPDWGRHINNLLMLIAVVLFGLGGSKSTFRGALRHPMLFGMATWAVAHLLANGDWASIILFGGLGIWALAEMVVINHAEPDWDRPDRGTTGGTTKLLAVSAVLYVAFAGVHIWLGYWPFAT
ncbi:MAG: NnrU family protein [Pseudomonadota bacterium]